MYKGTFYHPWRDLRSLKRDIHRVVTDFLGNEPDWEGDYWQPPVDIIETDNAYIVAAELPGMKKEEIKINLHEKSLQLSGEKQPFSGDKSKLRSEWRYGPFRRSIDLPDDINKDKISAKYENGILQVTVPREEKSKAKEIKIDVK